MEDDERDERSGPSRRGLGFLAPPAYIRSHIPQPQEAAPRDWAAWRERNDWAAWKEWNINPAGHGGRKGPPVFVLAESSYDDLGRSVLDGFGVDVEEGLKENKVGDDGAAVADWYRSLSASARASPAPTEDPDHKASGPARTYARPSTPAAAPSAPIRVHRSEWFIRRALASAPKHPTPKPSTASIGSMLNIDTAKPAPPPIPRYVLGPENVGFSRLAALGWAGGGLGRPEGWTEDEVTAQAPRPSPETGVVDLTADSEDSEDEQDEEEIKHGPGRTAPIATALKFNRLGLGRIPAEKRVSHSYAEIERARLQGAGKRHDAKTEPSKKAKIKWAEQERRDREHRARIAAALR